jgi:hypothetical protein
MGRLSHDNLRHGLDCLSVKSNQSQKSKVCYDRRSVCQPVLVSSPCRGPKTTFLLLPDSCGFLCVAPSLTRGRVCSLQLLLAFASAVILGSGSHGSHDILLSRIPDSPNQEGQVPVFVFSRNKVPQL